MKILILCNKSPYPPKEGGSIVMYSTINCLLEAGHQVKVLSMNTNKFHVDTNSIPSGFRDATGIEYVHINLSIHPLHALFNLFSSRSLHIQRFDSELFRKKLVQLLQQTDYDIVQLELLYMSPYIETIRRYSKAKIVLRSHNIEHRIWHRITMNTRNPIKRAYLKLLTKRLKKYEISKLQQYDGIISISKEDAQFYFQHNFSKPIIDIAFFIDLSQYKPAPWPEKTTLFHIGAMNWIPNEEGVRWFLEAVWPLIRKKNKDTTLHLAGRSMPEWLTKYNAPRVMVEGEVEDAKAFISSHSVMIAPLLAGGGIRIKILEAMALGRAVISTSVGAEGIPYENKKNILIADSPDDFADAVVQCSEHRQIYAAIGHEARKLIEREYNQTTHIERLNSFYKAINKK